MKYTVIKCLYSHETETKILRRNKLCVRIIRNFDYSDLNNLSYLHISKTLKIERKTLYNYFPEKETLHVVIALCLLEDIHKIKAERVKELKQLDLSNEEFITQLLFSTLDSIVFLKRDSLHYLKQFDTFLLQIANDEKNNEFYLKGINFLKLKYGVLEQELKNLIRAKIIISPINQTEEEIIFTIIETSYSYQNKLLCNNKLSSSEVSCYLFQYVQLLVTSYLN